MVVVAVLTAFNPNKELLIENIETLKNQLDKIIICNNSYEDLESLLNIPFDLKEKIEVINFNENIGIAKAQNIGMEKAFLDKKADLVLQMDQDSVLDRDYVSNIVNSFMELKSNGYKVGIIAGVVINSKEYFDFVNKKKIRKSFSLNDKFYQEVRALISSGSFISREAYLNSGKMMEELFIDHVDTEYCWRLKKNGFNIIKDFSAIISHNLGNGIIKYKEKEYLISKPIRNYYQIRNSLYLLKFSYVPLTWKKNEIKNIIRFFTLYPKIMDNGILRKKYMIKGIKDWYFGKMGKIDKELLND